MKIVKTLIVLLLAGILSLCFLIYKKNETKNKEIKVLQSQIQSQNKKITSLETQLKSKYSKKEFEEDIIVFKDKVLSAIAKESEETEEFLITKLLESEKKIQKLEDAIIKLIKKSAEHDKCCKKKVVKKNTKKIVKRPKKRIVKKKRVYKRRKVVLCKDTSKFKKCVNDFLDKKNKTCIESFKTIPKKISRKKKSNEFNLDESTVVEEDIIITSITPKSEEKNKLPNICSKNLNDFNKMCQKVCK